MAKLIYSVITSLDGFVEDQDGTFDWAMPSDEVHAFVNELGRPIGTYLYGRRMYETMVYWETVSTDDQRTVIRDYADIWRAADKVVFSKTLESVTSTKTRIQTTFDPDTIGEMKASGSSDLAVGGPELAAHAFRAGLVDEIHLFVNPVIVGGGKQALPRQVRAQLELQDECRFGNGVVHLDYRICT